MTSTNPRTITDTGLFSIDNLRRLGLNSFLKKIKNPPAFKT